jgi:hypothetical protein
MKSALEQNATDVVGRLKLLPRRQRIAHLRALLRQPLASSLGRDQLAALLRVEMIAEPANENRPV